MKGPVVERDNKSWLREIALVCFFVSGASGLMYEVAWNRMLGLVFGNTVFATSTVLTSFMAGLALGSYLSGRYADRIRRSLRAYAFLEIGIGLYCFLIPLLINLVKGIYLPLQRSLQLSPYPFTLVRFILCFLLLMIPATLMGATTPIFSRFYVKRGERLGHGLGRVYAFNTFGAFIGVVLSGFFTIEYLGVRNTINAAVAGNIAVAIVCLLMARFAISPAKAKADRAPAPSEEIPEAPGLSKDRRIALIVLMTGLGISGFAAMAYEVAWTRILAMIIGSSVYAFSIMLATFLVGIALGSFLFSMIARKRSVSLIWFGAAELIIGFAAILTLPVFERMPFYLVSIFEVFKSNYVAMQLSKFLLCSMVMIVPTILLGSLFPMVTQICTRSFSELGRRIGTIYSVNTLGNIGGSFICGFILIPYIGIQNSVILAAALNIVVGCAALFLHQALKFRYRAMVPVASVVVGVLCALAIPSWDKMIISSGPSVYAPQYAETKRGIERSKGISGLGEVLLYYKEGVEATVAVRKRPKTGTVVMAINGKVDASNSGDMYTQLMLGHIPLLLNPDSKTAMVIGLGSGVTLGAAAQYPLTRIDCAEIEPAVVEASEFFKRENRNVLQDPRVNLVETDARNYLAVNQRKYDVIISEPSNLWLSGTANLFSLEFFQLCKERLTSDGMIIQWAHVYHMSSEDLKIVINTFRSIFPNTSIWYSILGDIFMLGSNEKFTIDYLELAGRYNIPDVREDLQRLDVREPLALLSCYLLGEEDVARFAAGSRVNTDDRPILAFSAPRSLYSTTADLNHNLLSSFRTEEFPKMKNFNEQRVTNRASFWYHLGIAYDFRNIPEEARRRYERAISVDPNFAPAYVGLALNLYKDENVPDAVKNLKKAIELDPSGADAYYNLAQIYHSQGVKDEAIYNYKSAIRLSPRPWRYQQRLADLLAEYGDYSEAIQEYESALKGGINKPEILYGMAKAYKALDMRDNAMSRIQEAIAIDPYFAPLYEELGDLHEAGKEYEKAIEAYEKFAELEPDSVSVHQKLSRIYKIQGDLSSSRKEAKKAAELEQLLYGNP
jgi:spermidine synthase